MPSTERPDTSVYREWRPPSALRDHVVCLWTQTIAAGSAGHRQAVFPDGCVDLVRIDGQRPFVAGPMTRPVVVDLPRGARLRGVRLRPGAAAAVLHVSSEDIRDRSVDLVDLGRPAAAFSGEEAERGDEAFIAGVADLLTRADASDRLVRAAVDALASAPDLRIEALARCLDISERQLNRRVRVAVGYGPKRLQRILRFQRLLALAAAEEEPTAADLAYAAGFADQAHMVREVHALAGDLPSAVLPSAASTLALSDSFKIGVCS
ncbi:AraC family transcriptional regulator [Marinivivus vitaminiproducens]|uniref:AraC family transcriptional regulator n=1 Tax=Marinivivus vitaminiproducens TaxID=3035935 RepID=UPI0027A382E5|nr:helix-turn-helix domain-containing protein [Geminicoccaceae bacterium SCSIO 64248]